MRVLVFGGCNLRGPMYRASGRWPPEEEADWDDVPTDVIVVGPHFVTYTLGEMLQAIECYRGDRLIPKELHHLFSMLPENVPTPESSPLGHCDVAVIEPNTSIEI